VATGPGSFNGLRVAVTTAKMLALSLGIPLFGVPTLDVIAWGAADAPARIWATLDAGRGQLYAAVYAGPTEHDRPWRCLDGYHIVTPIELAARADGAALVYGEWSIATERALRDALRTPERVCSHVAGRRAAWLAELALARSAVGESDDPAALEPLYLRRPGITSSTKLARHMGKTGQVRRHLGEELPASEGEEAPHALRG